MQNIDLSSGSSPSWSASQKITFRFIFVFAVLFIIFENNGAYPFWFLLEFINTFLLDFIPWVGANILHLSSPVDLTPSGSGDTTFDNVLVFCILVVAAISTVIWSIVDRRRTSYTTLYYWITVAIRYYIAFMLFSYGMVKIFKLQFPYPDIYRMSEPYGKSTPMGLAWTFFGHSKGYNLFVGIAEVLSLLLLFRRTLTLGAVITLITTLNILAVNLFFDVPVKMMSTVLVLMTLFLLSRDLQNIWAFFLKKNPVHLERIPAPVFRHKWQRILKGTIKYLSIAVVVVWGTIEVSQTEGRDEAPKPAWYGLYEINEVTHYDDTVSTPHPAIFPWKEVVLGRENQVFVKMMNDSSCAYTMNIFVPDTTLTLTPNDERFENNKHVFHYDMSDSTNIRLTGRLNNDSVMFVLHQIADDENDFRLDTTAFHWISEKPNNR